MGLIKPQDNGSYQVTLPGPDDMRLPGLPVGQTGLWVKAILDEEKYIGESQFPAIPVVGLADRMTGQDVYAITDIITISEVVEIFSEISGKQVKSLGLSKEAFYSDEFKKQVGAEIWDNFELFYNE